MTSKKEFKNILQSYGIKKNDIIFVHSSMKELGPIEGRAEGVIEVMLELVGPDGLLVVPTHTWATVNDQQPVFHHVLSPSTVGILTNIVRQRPDAIRSLHPTHSVAAIGKKAKEFCADHELDNTPCSPKSPYAKLISLKGKILMLGVDLRRCTFFHCLEEIAGLGEIWSLDSIPHKRWIIKADGSILETTHRCHINGKSENYNRAESELMEAGILKKSPLGQMRIMVLDAAASAEYLAPHMKQNPKLFW